MAAIDRGACRHTGLAAGTVLAAATAADRYDVDPTAGVSTLDAAPAV